MYKELRPDGAFSNQVGPRLCGGRNLNSMGVKNLVGNKSAVLEQRPKFYSHSQRFRTYGYGGRILRLKCVFH